MSQRPDADFEGVFSEVLLRFVNARAGKVDAEIRAAQRTLCTFFDIDRSVVWEVVPGPPVGLRLTNLWDARSDASGLDATTGAAMDGDGMIFPFGGEIAPHRAEVDGATLFPWITQRAMSGVTVRLERVDNLPVEASIDAATLRQYHTKSSVVVPMKFGGAVTGLLTFATTEREHAWPDDLVARFELVARLFASALGRKEAELELRAATARTLTAVDVAGLGFYHMSRHGDVYALDARSRELLGLPADRTSRIREFWLEHVHPDAREQLHALGRELVSGRVDGAIREYRYLHDKRGVIWLRHSTRAVNQRDTGSGREIVGVFQDVTEARQREEALRTALADVERLQQQLQRENVSLREEVKSLKGATDIRGNSAAIQRALAQVEQVAPTSSTVLLLGETGTGKERFAEAIHARSRRHDRRMVRVNCAAIPTTLIESELFGREKGAYTGALSSQAGRFEQANGSTLFLDEIAELPLEVQTKLLRVLEEKNVQRLGSARPVPVDVRIIAATNRDLEKEVREGTFRDDLFYRLAVFPITVPPLRARLEDIPLLAKALVQELSAGVGKRFASIDHRDLDALVTYEWPGNVRELRNTIERAMIVCPGPRLRVPLPGAAARDAAPPQSLEQLERAHVLAVLQETGWRVSGPRGAAKLLGIRPTTLEHRMKKLGIVRPGRSSEP